MYAPRILCVLSALLVFGCEKSLQEKVTERLQTSEAIRSNLSFNGNEMATTVFARAGTSEEQITKVGCAGFGKPLPGLVVTKDPGGYSVARVRCGGGLINRKPSHPSYPEVGKTYLSFTPPSGNPLIKGHGFQVEYYESKEQSWLWYPGNARGLPGEWKVEDKRICYRRSENTINPVTGKIGGKFNCASKKLGRAAVVSSLDGDAFKLATGDVPYRLDRCKAPDEFEFDREDVACR